MGGIMLSVIMLSVITLSVSVLSIVKLSVVKLSVVKLSVIMLSVNIPPKANGTNIFSRNWPFRAPGNAKHFLLLCERRAVRNTPAYCKQSTNY